MEDKVLAYTGHERQAHTTSNTHGNKQPQPQHQPQQPTSHNHPHNQIRRDHVSQPCFFISLSCLIISHQFGFHLSHSCSAYVYLVTHDCWLVTALMMRMALLHLLVFCQLCQMVYNVHTCIEKVCQSIIQTNCLFL